MYQTLLRGMGMREGAKLEALAPRVPIPVGASSEKTQTVTSESPGVWVLGGSYGAVKGPAVKSKQGKACKRTFDREEKGILFLTLKKGNKIVTNKCFTLMPEKPWCSILTLRVPLHNLTATAFLIAAQGEVVAYAGVSFSDSVPGSSPGRVWIFGIW